jgi:tetratricopeptide (TPR) repeat protein
LPFYTNANPDDVFPKAKEAVAKALEIDSSLPEAHGTLAYILTYNDWNWAEGEKEFQKSLALNPNDATQRHRYSRYLASLGRIDEALTELERARLLDPLDLVIKLNGGIIYFFARRSDDAIGQFQNLLRENPDFRSARWGLGLAYEQKGSYQQALPELEAAGKGKVPNSLASLAHLYGLMGKKQQAREILTQLKTRAREENISGYFFALIHLGLGETEAAMGELQRAYQEHATVLSYLRADSRFDLLRNEPQFRELLSKIGLGQ